MKTYIEGYLSQLTKFSDRLDVNMKGERSRFPLGQSNWIVTICWDGEE